MAQISQPPPGQLGVGVDLARASTTVARDGPTSSVLHGKHGEATRWSGVVRRPDVAAARVRI